MKFDAALTYASFQDHMHKATTPRQREILETVVRHSKGEVLADLDMVLPTLSDDPQYHEYGVYAGTTEDRGPKGLAAVRKNYEAMVESGSYVIESRKNRVVVTDDEVVTEGTFRQILTAKAARDMGFVGDDAEGFFLLSARTVVFWEFDVDGKAKGEDRYVLCHKIEPLAKEDLPDDYPSRLLADA